MKLLSLLFMLVSLAYIVGLFGTVVLVTLGVPLIPAMAISAAISYILMLPIIKKEFN